MEAAPPKEFLNEEEPWGPVQTVLRGGGADHVAPGWTGLVRIQGGDSTNPEDPSAALLRLEDSCQEGPLW